MANLFLSINKQILVSFSFPTITIYIDGQYEKIPEKNKFGKEVIVPICIIM